MIRKPRLRLDGWDALAAIVVVATSLLYAREIGNDFLWGHDGGNGAPYWNAAANSLRFGVVGQLKDYTGLGPPSPADFYTHHPLLLHFHLVLVRAVLGSAEWVGRLVPFVYSVGTLVLLHRLARRLYTPAFALVTLVIYALVPLHLIFASMLDQQQGGIFWTLLASFGSVRWLVAGRGRKGLVLVVVAGTLAMQFSWASYFVLGVTGALALVMSLFAPRSGPREIAGPGEKAGPRERAGRLAFVLLATALANLAFFFLLIRVTKGSLDDMQSALALRSSEVTGYGDSMLQRGFDLYGPLLLGLTGAGLTRLVTRARRGLWRTRDILPVSFLVGQLGVSVIFRNAGRIHAYWTYYVGVACALLAAEAVMAVLSWLRRRISKVGVAVVASAVALFHASFALGQQDWGLATGHAAYPEAFDDQFEEVQLAKWLHARYGRDVTYSLHASFNARTEVFTYLDAPHLTVEEISSTAGRCPTRACVLVVDLRRAKSSGTLPLVSALVESHRAEIFGAHLLVVDLGAGRDEPRAYHLDVRPAGDLYRWFVNGRHGPASWVAVEGAQEVLASTLVEGAVPKVIAESTKEGRALAEHCAKGGSLAGIVVRTHEGSVVALRGICLRDARRELTAWIGDPSEGQEVERTCAPGEAVVGLQLPSVDAIGETTVACSGSAGDAGAPYVLGCPKKMVAVSLHARRAGSLVGIGLGCALPLPSPPP